VLAIRNRDLRAEAAMPAYAGGFVPRPRRWTTSGTLNRREFHSPAEK
jgi:hypothetical protein